MEAHVLIWKSLVPWWKTPKSPPEPIVEPDVIGYCDGHHGNAVKGWVRRPSASAERLLVHVFVNGRFFGQGRADRRRPDLCDLGIGDGCYGFLVMPPFGMAPLEVGDEIRVVAVTPAWMELKSACNPEGARTTPAPSDARQYLATVFAGGFVVPPGEGAALPERPPAGPIAAELLARASPIPDLPPALGHPVSAYLDHVRYKWDIAGKYDPTNSLTDYEAYLRHYLEGYAVSRYPLRAPLSATEIAFLDGGTDSVDPDRRTRAQQLFAGCFAPVANGDDAMAYIYAWAVHHTIQLGGEDCLVPASWVARLRAVKDATVEFPLSDCLERFVSDNCFLRTLDTATIDGRRTVYLAIALFAISAPHLLLYVPPQGLAAYLAPDATGRSPFEADVAEMLPGLGLGQSGWRDAVAATGFDLDAGRFRTTTTEGHRLEPVCRTVTGETVDVQIIGPFSRRLGLADSCHMLASALAKLNLTLRCCDYTLDYPNERRSGGSPDLQPAGPARLNVLHVNLEELPSAFAYLPDIFTGAYNVACPYTEVTPPHPAQRLGLTLIDEIWSASSFMTEVLGPHRATHTVGTAVRGFHPHGKVAARVRSLGDRVGPGDFVFLTAGDALSGVHRKNPLGVIRAFLEAFPHDPTTRLIVKVHSTEKLEAASPDHHVWRKIENIAKECDRVHLIRDLLTDDEQGALIEGADCLVSLHRAEGFGYHMAEAMRLGTPVVATAYSGNTDFCTEATAYLVPYRLIPIERDQYPRATAAQIWADPDFAGAVAALRSVRRDSVLRDRKIAAARELIDRAFSLDAYAARLAARIEAISRARAGYATSW